ncbi:MAG: transporter substrate-binding domain-containing protein [Coriobacteriales bacterium]|jgi:L-cystine transport system substrate-binding protein|nr:transporter substrate-binding domain-containing protein [Coriobacteriales bacterium]
MTEYNSNISRRTFIKGLGFTVAGLGATGILSACGGGGSASGDGGGSTTADVKNLRVATGIGGFPLFDVDEQGKPVGFEYEVLKRVSEDLPQYKFNFEPIAMDVQLTELASNRLDIGSHDYEDNEQRRENYLFSGTPHWDTYQVFYTLDTRTDLKSFDDLVGKSIITFPSSNSAYALEQWNIEHPDKTLEIDYVASIDALVADLQTGVGDALLWDTLWLNFFEAYDIKLKAITKEPFVETGVYFLFPKDHTAIEADVSEVLKQLKESGELDALKKEHVYDVLGIEPPK